MTMKIICTLSYAGDSNKYIPAIKDIRIALGWGLKEARDLTVSVRESLHGQRSVILTAAQYGALHVLGQTNGTWGLYDPKVYEAPDALDLTIDNRTLIAVFRDQLAA